MRANDKKLRRAIEKQCREEAREMMLLQYERYDAIWWNRIRITPALYDHGRETVREINRIMPNLLTHNPICSPVDLVAEQFGFADTSDLVEYLLAYTPRGPVEDRFYAQLFEYRLREGAPDAPPHELDDVPF
jgi:hypothetical protein